MKTLEQRIIQYYNSWDTMKDAEKVWKDAFKKNLKYFKNEAKAEQSHICVSEFCLECAEIHKECVKNAAEVSWNEKSSLSVAKSKFGANRAAMVRLGRKLKGKINDTQQ